MNAFLLTLCLIAQPRPSGEINYRLTPPQEDARYRSVLEYRREQLRIMPVYETFWSGPTLVGAGSLGPVGPRGGPGGIGFGFNTGRSTTRPGGWAVVQGAATILDEEELAILAEQPLIVQRIHETRKRRQWWWGGTLAGISVATLTPALIWRGDPGSGLRSASNSLIAFGVVSAVLAAVIPWTLKGHVLESREAAALADQHNERLRESLGLRPSEIDAEWRPQVVPRSSQPE